MGQVFGYIIALGASVMMPIIFTIIGMCIGMKFGKALKSGLFVGVGFVGLGVVTALLTTNFNSPLKAISDLYHLQLNVFDMGWPAAAAVAYNTAVGALIIPICLGVNFLMLITKTTRTVNIDLWNYWHFASSVLWLILLPARIWHGAISPLSSATLLHWSAQTLLQKNSKSSMIWTVSPFLSLSARVSHRLPYLSIRH